MQLQKLLQCLPSACTHGNISTFGFSKVALLLHCLPSVCTRCNKISQVLCKEFPGTKRIKLSNFELEINERGEEVALPSVRYVPLQPLDSCACVAPAPHAYVLRNSFQVQKGRRVAKTVERLFKDE